ncbi:MAG: fructokinase [Gammaproteobacteria bacterium]
MRAPWWTRATLETRLGHCRWVKLNEDELTLLAGGAGTTETLASRLLERHHIAIIFVTLGARGALLASNRGEVVHATDVPAPTAVVDTVGASDACSSVCILGFLHDCRPQHCSAVPRPSRPLWWRSAVLLPE